MLYRGLCRDLTFGTEALEEERKKGHTKRALSKAVSKQKGPAPKAKDKEKRRKASVEVPTEAKHAGTRKERRIKGKTDRAEGSAEAMVPVPRQTEDKGRFCDEKRSCRGECRGGPLRHRCSFLGPLKDATATRVFKGLFVILPLGTSPIYTH